MPNESIASMRRRFRRATRARRDIAKGLNRTHDLGVSDGSLPAGIFPAASRALPITFTTRVLVSGAAAAGLILEFGDNVNGVKLGISGGEWQVAAGEATTGTDGVNDDYADAALGTTGYEVDVALAINPGIGKVRLFLDGRLVMRVQQSTPEQFLNGVWAAAGAGSVGAAQNGTSTQRTTAVINGAPSDFSLVKPVSAFVNQLPRHFDS